MFRRCKHPNRRCIHGDEVWARMKIYPWKTTIRRQACLDCGRALDLPSICSERRGQHSIRDGAQKGDE